MKDVELTILIPCLNEAKTIKECIDDAKFFINKIGASAEILVADNGSDDGSQEIARAAGARVVNCSVKGYGAALLTGMNAAKGKFVIFGDADCSYDFKNMDGFVDELRNGADLVVGNRFKGGIEKGAMPFLHQYLGNPLLSWVGKKLFTSKLSDFHCGLRGFRNETMKSLGLRCSGMEFASEMIAKAGLANFKIVEVATTLSKDKRGRPAHLKTWRDGWRHLKFLLMFAAKPVFFWPGISLLLVGIVSNLVLSQGKLEIFQGVTLNTSTLLMACLSMIVGCQLLTFYSMLENIRHRMFAGFWGVRKNIFSSVNFELALIIGSGSLIAGISLILWSVYQWSLVGFGETDVNLISRFVFNGATFFAIGIQLFGAIFANAAINYSLSDEPVDKT